MINQLYKIQMHNYKGQLRRELQDHTPTKSSWQREREAPQQPSKYQPRYDNKYDTRQEERIDQKYEGKFQTKYDKSQISYYQSQNSRVVYDYDKSERPSTRSQAYFQDDRYLFNQVMMVRIKSFEREEFEQKLRLQILNKNQKGYSLLTIFLTDDSNPKFLWTFAIKEGDFMNLKNEQKLKVSYSSFPQMLQNCFKECQSGSEFQGQAKNNHLLLQIRKGGEGTLYVLQSNRYKESVHLFLHFKLANDEQIKEHLSNKLMISLDQNARNRSAISNLENTLSQRMHQIQHLTAQLNQIKSDGQKRMQQVKLQQKRKMNQIESKNLNEVAKVKRQNDLQLKQLKQKLGSQIQNLTKSKNQLINKLSEARQKIVNFQSNQRQYTTKISRLEQQANKNQKQYERTKLESRELSERYIQSEKQKTELTCKVQSLKSELEDKKTIISSTVQLKETNNNQITSLQQISNEQRKQIIKLQTKITQLQGQIQKSNSEKGQLIAKISRQKQKLTERAEIIKQQEKQVRQLKKKQATLLRQNQNLQIKTEDKESKIKNLHENLVNIQQKLQDQKKLVIALQKALNERPALRTTSNYTTAYQPTMPYSGLNRELPSQLSANSNISTSRIASSLNNVPLTKDKIDKYEPNIRRYEERSKSPLPKRLTQQRDPDQQQNAGQKVPSFQQPRPIKFKMSQPGREAEK